MDALGKSVSTIPKKPNQQYLYQRLHDTLLFLHDFFNAGGEGLTGEHLDTEQYKVSHFVHMSTTAPLKYKIQPFAYLLGQLHVPDVNTSHTIMLLQCSTFTENVNTK